MAPAAQLGFAELHDELGVSASGPSGVDARSRNWWSSSCACVPSSSVPTRRRLGWRRARSGRQVAELMRSDFHPQCLRTVLSIATLIAAWVLGLPVKVTNTASGRLPITAGAISLR